VLFVYCLMRCAAKIAVRHMLLTELPIDGDAPGQLTCAPVTLVSLYFRTEEHPRIHVIQSSSGRLLYGHHAVTNT
jgi:hypothetical protein